MSTLPANVRSSIWWAYTLSVNNQPIGNLQSFNPTFSKTVDRVREILFDSGPKVVDIVPGICDISATMERIRLFSLNLMQSIGTDVRTIEDFNQPFDILETMNRPAGAAPVRTAYRNCLFTEYGTTISVGTTFVMERATVLIATVTPA